MATGPRKRHRPSRRPLNYHYSNKHPGPVTAGPPFNKNKPRNKQYNHQLKHKIMKTKGLTDKEIENARKKLHRKAQARAEKAGRPGLYMLHELWPYYTPAMKRQDRELDCREMINSCLAYGELYYFYKDGELVRYANEYVFAMGEKRVLELLTAQQERFRTATVHAGVYTDAEGCSYNSITW